MSEERVGGPKEGPVTLRDLEEVLSKHPRTRGKEIVPAQRVLAQDLRPEIERILSAIGVKGAWVSDRSRVGDFATLFELRGQSLQQGVAGVSRELGLPVAAADLLVDIARRLRERTPGNDAE